MEYARTCKAKVGFTSYVRERPKDISVAIIGYGGSQTYTILIPLRTISPHRDSIPELFSP